MSRITRRATFQTALGALAAGRLASGKPLRTTAPGTSGIKLAMMCTAKVDHKARISKQIGCNHSICGVTGLLGKLPKAEYEAALAKVVAEFKAAGLAVAAVESHPVPAEKIKLGIDGRDEEIENYIAAIRALANVGIPVLCYNFMAGLGWYRTRVATPARGGALITEFDNRVAKAQGPTQWGEIPGQKIWDNLAYFHKAVIPVAEKYGIKMALHPDDPPLTPLRGIGRILVNAANYRRALNIVPSPINGITFCQANFVAMGEDVEALAREWCGQKKIFFVHFRDIEGNAEAFRETFHDNGVTDMARMLKVYSECGFDGPIRPDHAPTLDEETNDRPGYAIQGKIFAIGYIKGVLDAHKLPYA